MSLAKLSELKIGTKVYDKNGKIGVVVEDEDEEGLFFDFEKSEYLLQVSAQAISRRGIKISKLIVVT